MNDSDDQPPDGSLNPATHRNSFVVDRTMAASPDEISMNVVAGALYWFDVHHQGEHYAHYGRFLRVEAGRLIEQTWLPEETEQPAPRQIGRASCRERG